MAARMYRVAPYYRLSREDGNDESQSIQSQREMVTAFINKQQGWLIVDEYVDDGYSGTNFKRPDFERLIEDIELGKIDIVITKDLSRLGRNYVAVGYYMEEYFPERNIRYIALIDGYDSDKEDCDDFVPFKNVINEYYAKDTSKKIRSILDNKARNGEARNTVVPLFGYMYNEAFERIPDPETAPIVKLVFKKFIELGSTEKVAIYLTDHKIKTPRYYNAIKYNYKKAKVLAQSEDELCRWTRSGVYDILKKEEYLGVYKTAQSKSISFKNKKRYRNKECYVFENRYEPLIDKVTWEMAKKLIRVNLGSSVPIAENIFRGMLYCEDCGKKMRLEKRSNIKKMIFDYRYYCNNQDCEFNNSITKAMLESAVIREIMQLKDIILSRKDDFLAFAATFDTSGRNIKTDIESELAKAMKRSSDVDVYIEKLFEQNVTGNIPTSTFNMMMAKYKREKEAIESEVRDLQRARNAEIANPQNELRASELIGLLEGLVETNILKPYIIQRLIKKIIVRTKFINNSMKNREIYLTFHYFGCDDIIQGFMKYEG